MVTPRVERYELDAGHQPVVDPDALFARPTWMADAACKEHELELFFADDRATQEQAKQVCRACLVVTECAAYAMADKSLVGVWGALTTADRRRLRGGR